MRTTENIRQIIHQGLIAIFFLLPLSPLFAQSPTTTLETYLTAIRQGQRPSPPQQLWQTPQQYSATLAALVPYFTDTVPKVRAQAYYLAKQVGAHSLDETVRQQVTSQLVEALSNPDHGITGRMYSYLAEFNPADFTAPARQQIADLLPRRPAHFSGLLKLVGTLGMTDQIPRLQSLLPDLPARERWTAQLVLARLGNQEALANVLARVKQQPVNDDLVYELLPDLVYTHQKEAIDYLIAIVQSEEKNCQSANPEAEGNILCGYRVLELLVPVIKDFPLSVDASGDLAVDDYPKALAEARRWLREHADYQVVG